MKSIKEKANELYPELHTDSDDWDVIEEQCDRDDQRKAFVLGANYVLEKFVDIVNKNTKPNGMEDRAKMASDMLILIAQLKK